jgi:hypothetical protein
MHQSETTTLDLPLRRPRPDALALLALLGVLAAVWLLSGMPFEDGALLVGYELAYVLLPGCLLYLLLRDSSGDRLRVLAIGWPLGYALEMGTYALTAALHVREVFAFLPLVGLATMGPLLMRRGDPRRMRVAAKSSMRRLLSPHGAVVKRPARLDLMVLAAAVGGAATLLAVTFFAAYPLPAHAHSVFYYVDNMWDLSIAAEARHHWPIAEPYVAGRSLLHYYYGVFLHIAAVNQVTGVPMSTVVLRLLPTMAIVVPALQLWSLGRALGRSLWVGPITVVLFLVVADLNLDPTRPTAFGTDLFNTLGLSPTFAFGIPLFLALIGLVQSRCAAGESTAEEPARRDGLDGDPRFGRWLVLVAILVLAVSAVKTSAAVDFIGGLALLWLWHTLTRGLSRLLSYCLAVSLACSGLVYVLMLRGGIGGSLVPGPLAFIHYTDFATVYGAPLPLRIILLTGVAAVACLFATAPLLGACWLLYRRSATSPFVIFSAAVFAVSLAAYLLLNAPGGSQGYFFAFGYIGILPVAAKGLVLLWQDTSPGQRRRLLRACCLILLLGLLAAGATSALTHAKGIPWDIWYALAYGLLAVAIVLGTLRLESGFLPAIASRWARMLACCILMLGTLGLVKPLASLASHSWDAITQAPVVLLDSRANQGMTAALYQGLIWVRNHTKACDLLAVNNHLVRANADDTYSRYYYYSAFTERRVFLESWYITPRGVDGVQPYPGRLALNNLAILDANPSALRQLRRDGVDYVLIDKIHGGGAAEPSSVSQLVFTNGALDVYRLLGPRGSQGTCT